MSTVTSKTRATLFYRTKKLKDVFFYMYTKKGSNANIGRMIVKFMVLFLLQKR